MVLKTAIWLIKFCKAEGAEGVAEGGKLTVDDGEEVTAGVGRGRREIKKTTNEIKAAAGIRRINNLGRFIRPAVWRRRVKADGRWRVHLS